MEAIKSIFTVECCTRPPRGEGTPSNEAVASLPMDVQCRADKGVRIVEIQYDELDEAVNVLARSYGGSAGKAPNSTLDWCIGPALREQWDNPQRKAYCDSVLMWLVNTTFLGGGVVLGVREGNEPRNEATAEERGRLLAVLLAVPPHAPFKSTEVGPTSLLFWRSCLATFAWGLPTDVEGARARFGEIVWPMERELHEKNAPDPHWFVWAVGVLPEAQGRGCARVLLDAVANIAKRDDVESYLEVGCEKNIAVFKKMGYEVVAEATSKGFDCDPSVHGNQPPLVMTALKKQP
eukprot:NODE_1317_length_1177_cov_414.095365.p2 GENE.NODE_1317_length_1177_cov_414.095365~~NODE_1317_length_1177_cov_414.095365.p2  ORF type:complete len:292 (-),score=96.14 NODE_1317_length_1177_cov_414.095365:146-1021(-)